MALTQESRPNAVRFLGFEAELQFQIERSAVFELLERHSAHACSLVGWLDIHYPCAGQHELHIRACLNPDIAQFESHENFGGNPSEATQTLMEQLVREVCQYLEVETSVSWHLDLEARSFGTMVQNPNYML